MAPACRRQCQQSLYAGVAHIQRRGHVWQTSALEVISNVIFSQIDKNEMKKVSKNRDNNE